MAEEEKDVNVEQVGAGLMLVDPNPSGRNVLPAEDMFIYVSLTAQERNRGVVTIGENENEFDESRFGEIEFVATEVKYNQAGEPMKDIMGDVKSYATTNYTNIGGIQNTFGSGLLEGFGITSINVKYNTSLIPQVDIDFTDIRGSGLFDVIEQDNRKSPYSVFFKMPYPIFNLTLKGYFGKPVEYCLNLVNWTSKFDPGTGNFNISANFVGFQQAFLADITIGDIIGTVNTEAGLKNLLDLPLTVGTVKEGGETGSGQIATPQLDEFVKDLSKLQIDLEELKIENTIYKELQVLNTQQKKLEDIRGFIGRPLGKANIDTYKNNESAPPYLSQLNSPLQISSSSIKSQNLTSFKNYLSIRDLLFVKTTVNSSVDNYMNDLYDKVNDYVKFYGDNSTVLNANDNIAKKSVNGAQINSEYWKFSENNNGESVDYEQFKLTFAGGGNTTTLTLESFIDELKKPDSILKSNNPKEYAECNQNFDVSGITINNYSQDLNDNKPGNKNSDFSNSDVGFVLDFRAIRMMVNDMLITLNKEKKKKEEKLLKELNDALSVRLGYKPTIGTVFQIICNNAQAFLATIYDIGRSAELQNRARQKALERVAVNSDIQLKEEFDFKSQTIYAFPSVFVKKDGGFVEKYIGSEDIFPPDDQESRNAFPEIGFIEDLIKALLVEEKKLLNITKQINKAKRSSSGDDTDNWIPNNPIDYKNNPFYLLNSSQSKSAEGAEKLYEKFISILVDRFIILTQYSNSTKPSTYGGFDGLLANISFVDDRVKNILYTFLNDTDNNDKIKELRDKRLKELNSTIYQDETGDDKIYHISNPKGSFIIMGNSNKGREILKNNVTLTEEQKDTEYERIYVDKKVIDDSKENYIEWSSRGKLITANQSYNVFNTKTKDRLVSKLDKGKIDFIIDNDITLLDGGINPNNNPAPNTPTETDTINLYLNSKFPLNNIDNTQKAELLTNSKLYQNNTSELSKALLLLSTLPFSVFDNIQFPEVSNFTQPACVVTLPKYFLLYIGGTLWRQNLSTDPIIWDDSIYSGSTIPTQQQYITPLWSSNQRGDIESQLLNLPTQTKSNFINYFTNWVNSGDFTKFANAVIEYSDDDLLTTSEKFDKGTSVVSFLKKEEKMIVVSTGVLNITPSSSKFSDNGFSDYFNQFKLKFKGSLVENKDKTTTNSEKDDITKNMDSLKQSAFNSIKNVYDRWVAGNTSKEKLAFNACANDGTPLFDYFRFVDRGFNDIGDKAIINLESVITLSENLTTNVYFFMSKLLRDSNFLFQILPNYINYKDPEEVSTMFKPITNISDRNTSSGPTYLCIYAGGASQVLNIEEQNRYTFKNDGFNLDFPPSDISAKKVSDKRAERQKNRKEKNLEKRNKRREERGKAPIVRPSGEGINLVGFRVSFGTENQTVFKSVSLNQQEHKDTAEYHKTLTDLIDKRGGTSRSYQGTDLYKMFRARSYTCNVEALGCMNIQPMMYFQLDNVPFFEGAYMILNVTHNISPNHMTTSFTGVRQSKYLTPVVDKMTTFLNIGLDDTLDTEPIFERSSVAREIDFNTGIPKDKGPDEQFNFDSLNEGSLITMGVSNVSLNLVNSLKSELIGNGITSNSQVTMFLANALTKSNNFSTSVDVWNDKNSTAGKELYASLGNRFGNRVNTDDAYIYRPKGYIPIIGRDQYQRFSKDTNTPLSTLTGNTINVATACRISTWRWINYPYSNSYHNDELLQEIDIRLKVLEELKKDNEEIINTPQNILNNPTQTPQLQIQALTEIEKIEIEFKELTEKIIELQEQKDERLKTEENYPPGGWANGGQASNFSRIVESLNFSGGKDIEDSFENFAKVLNALPTKDGDDNLLGQTVDGTKFKSKGVNLYKENKNSNQTIASTV